MTYKVIFAATAALLATACVAPEADAPAQSAAAPASPALSFDRILDRTITDESGVTLTILSDQTYTGTAPGDVTFGGTWALKGDQYCETMVRRSGMIDETCYSYDLSPDGVTFTEPGEAGRFFAL